MKEPPIDPPEDPEPIEWDYDWEAGAIRVVAEE